MQAEEITALTFGEALRTVRIKAGFMTIRAWADALSRDGLIYSEDALGKYENDARRPGRKDALRLFEFFVQHDGLRDLRDVNRLLWLLGLRNADEDEIERYFPQIAYTAALDNLPPQPPYDRLIGRESELDQLVDYLLTASAKPILVLSGLGGIGKTALAYEVVRRVMRAGIFSQLAWESLKSEEFIGVERRRRSTQILDVPSSLMRIARQLGLVLPTDMPLNALQANLRTHLRQGAYLIVVDNLESSDAVREVVHMLYELVSPSASAHPSKILVTSRERLVDETYVYDHFIDGLSAEATQDFLIAEATSRGAESLMKMSPILQERVFGVTGGMPLALKLLVSQYMLGIALDEAIERLEQAVDEQELYRFIYFALWEKMSIDSQLVIGAAASYGFSVSRDMLIDTCELDAQTFAGAIRELVRMSLIEVNLYPEMRLQRYSIHALTRWFVNAPLVELWHQQKGQSDATDG